MAEEKDPNAEPGQNQPAAVETEEEMTEEAVKELHEAEDFISNFDPKDLSDPDKAAELEEKLSTAKTTVAQKRHYRDKYNEVKEKPKPTPEVKKEPGAPATPVVEKKDEPKGIDPNVATNFRLDHPELSKEQQVKVIAHASAYGTTPEEALKDPLMETYIASTNTVEDVENASPAPGQQPGGVIKEKDWSNATPAEMDEARNKMMFPNG